MEIEKNLPRPYSVLGPVGRRLCWECEAWIIGGCVNYLLGTTEQLKDIDIMVPLHRWPNACRMIPSGAAANSFGGFKFKDGQYDCDVWPGDVAETLCLTTPQKIRAFQPMRSVLLTSQGIYSL